MGILTFPCLCVHAVLLACLEAGARDLGGISPLDEVSTSSARSLAVPIFESSMSRHKSLCLTDPWSRVLCLQVNASYPFPTLERLVSVLSPHGYHLEERLPVHQRYVEWMPSLLQEQVMHMCTRIKTAF